MQCLSKQTCITCSAACIFAVNNFVLDCHAGGVEFDKACLGISLKMCGEESVRLGANTLRAEFLFHPSIISAPQVYVMFVLLSEVAHKVLIQVDLNVIFCSAVCAVTRVTGPIDPTCVF